MKLTRVEVRNYRSIFERMPNERGLRLELQDGLNVLVGRNNCGKSNVFRAIAAALDPAYEFVAAADIPGPLTARYPSIQAWFRCNRDDSEEAALLDAADTYERLVTKSNESRAQNDQFVLRTSFVANEQGGFDRRVRMVFLDGSDDPGLRAENLRDIVERFRSLVRFVMVSSGESIESVLEGNFREILHTVVRDRMGAEFAAAEGHRDSYIKGLQSELLGPLREVVTTGVSRLFPEITQISLVPDVSDIESTLARVEIALHDAVSTPLSQKGTGVRGGVLVAMLRYIAQNTNRCVIFAVEEPEAFLHPAAQEELREDLEALAERDDVSVLVTTHSPFILSSRESALALLLDKDFEGRTQVTAQSRGGDQRVAVISGILKEQSLEEIVAAASAIPPGKNGVVLVEGYGDRHYLEMAAGKLGRRRDVADLHIVPSNGCSRMANLAVLMRASTDLPIAIVLDNDEPGRKAAERLSSLQDHNTKSNLFNAKKQIISYRQLFKDTNFEWEAEDLFDPSIVERFVDERGGRNVLDKLVRRPDEGFHFDMSEELKIELAGYLDQHATAEHCERWGDLIDLLRDRLGLPDQEPISSEDQSEDLAVEAPSGTSGSEGVAVDGSESDSELGADDRVLVVSQNYGHAEYLRSGVFVGEPGRGLSPDIRYVAFYENGEIREEVPRVIARYDDLVFTAELAERLEASAKPEDARLAEFITEELDTGRRAPGETRQVFLLTDQHDPATITLGQRIKNTKLSPKGKPMAWVVRHKLTWKNALLGGATTTGELDSYEEAAS